jgi:chitodextrinase
MRLLRESRTPIRLSQPRYKGALTGLLLACVLIGATAASAPTASAVAFQKQKKFQHAPPRLRIASRVLRTIATARLRRRDKQAPSSPTRLTVTGSTQSSVAIAWTAATDNVGVAGYGIYQDGQSVGVTARTSYTLTGLSCGTTYTVGVDAYDAAGNRSSRTSVLAATSACPDTQAPSMPSGLVAGAAGATGVVINWTASSDNVGVAGYDVYQDIFPVGQTTATSYALADLTCGSIYVLAVDAYDAAGNRSAAASITVATAPCPDLQPPTTPTGLAQTAATGNSITLGWSPSSDNVGVAGYDVYNGSTELGSTTTTSYTVSGLECGTSYTVSVDAYDAAGNHSSKGAVNAATSACASPGSSGLVAAYAFNEGSGGNVGDASGNGNSGSVTRTTWTTAGKYGGALAFDGSSSSVTVNDAPSLDLTNGMTLEAWVKPSAVNASWRTVALKERSGGLSYALYADSEFAAPDGRIFSNNEYAATGATELPVNVWSHLAVAYDGTTIRLFLNGTLVSSSSVGGTIQPSAGPLRIGGNGVWGEWFAGSLDEIRVYNRPLSASEIQADVATPIGSGPVEGPVPSPTPDTQPPSTPSGLSVTGTTQTSISLSWTASTDNTSVGGYHVYRDGALVGSVSQTSYTVGGLSCGTSHTLEVDGYDAAGNSSPKAAIVAAVAACPDTQPPTVPPAITQAGKTSTSLSIGWTPSTDNVGVVGYGLYQGDSRVGSTTQMTYTFTGLSCGTSYTLGVDAYDGAGNRSARATAVLSTGACPPADATPPSAPTALSSTAATSSSISLSWTAATDDVGVAGYGVYNGSNRVASTTSTSYTVGGLACGTSYTFGIDAYDAAGNRSVKVTITASTSACAPSTNASVYVSTSGSDSNACTQSAPCKTFNRAYRVAQPGQVVEVAGGTYPSQTITYDAAKTSSDDVVIQPAAGSTVQVSGGLHLGTFSGDGPRHLTIKNIQSVPYDGSTTTGFQAGEGTQDVTWVNLDASNFYLRGIKDFHIVGGDWGPCYMPTQVPDACGNNKIDYAAPPYANDNITIDGARFHNLQCGGYGNRAAHDCSGTGIHFECVFLAGGTNIVIRNSTFRDCEFYDIFVSDVSSKTGVFNGLRLENNWFDTPWDGQRNQSRPGAVAFKPNGAPSPAFSDVLLRFNSFRDTISVNDDGDGNVYSNFRIVGNIFGEFDGCYPSATFAYNASVGGTCNGTERSLASLPFLNAAGFDFHLTGGAAVDLVSAVGSDEALGDDIDGQARPMGPARDAGADELR